MLTHIGKINMLPIQSNDNCSIGAYAEKSFLASGFYFLVYFLVMWPTEEAQWCFSRRALDIQ